MSYLAPARFGHRLAMGDLRNDISFIRQHTEIISPFSCPELSLHLITDTCPMWSMNENEVANLGIDAPYWGFVWPGGHALARYLLDHPNIVNGKRVLDFGTGTGIVALAAAKAGAKKVLASDIDSLALSAVDLNAELNAVEIETTDRNFIGTHETAWDIVLVADVCYEAQLASQVTKWLYDLNSRGVEILIGDPKRGWLAVDALRELGQYETPSDIDCRGTYLQYTSVYSLS